MAIGIREETAGDHRALARLQHFVGPQDILFLALQRRISRLDLHGSGASEAVVPQRHLLQGKHPQQRGRRQPQFFPCRERQEAAAREGDAGEADAEAVLRGGEEPHVHQVERPAGLQEEEAAGGSAAVDGEQGPGAREGERVPGGQADRATGARAGPEGDVRAQLRAAAAPHPALLQRLEIWDPLVWLIELVG